MKSKNAFTLAEVLITLAIIGIVAALTIPNLIQSYKKLVVETRLAKFYSAINQAITLSEVDNGSRMLWDTMEDRGTTNLVAEGISAEEWFNKYLKNYMKVIKSEQSDTVEKKYNLYFSDGSMLTFSGSSWLYYPYANDYKEHEVQNGDDEDSNYIDRQRDDAGIKYFTFQFAPTVSENKWHYKKGVEPFLYKDFDGSAEMLKNHANLGCKKASVGNERAYCTELIKRNGWKIPKDYPFKF